MTEMTKAALRDICTQHKLYRTPELNDKLYCNFKGFKRIANLEAYTKLKALFLEGNALDSLDGMPLLEELKCLYVQNNCISSLAGLERLPNLDTLNISSNCLTNLDGLTACTALNSLIAEHNKLDSLHSIAALAECTSLHTLDLQHNKLDDPEVLSLFTALPELRCLYLRGNPVVSKIKNYRKTLIAAIPTLTYLDDRPVFELERRCAEAWSVGGMDAERAERQKVKDEEAARDRRNFEFMKEIRRAGFRKRREMLGLPAGDTDPILDNMSDADDDDFEVPAEPQELKDARAALAAYTSRPGEEEPPELSQARTKHVRDGGPVAEGDWASDDTGAYIASVHQSQQSLDADGAALMQSERGDVVPLPVSCAAVGSGAAAAAALSRGSSRKEAVAGAAEAMTCDDAAHDKAVDQQGQEQAPQQGQLGNVAPQQDMAAATAAAPETAVPAAAGESSLPSATGDSTTNTLQLEASNDTSAPAAALDAVVIGQDTSKLPSNKAQDIVCHEDVRISNAEQLSVGKSAGPGIDCGADGLSAAVGKHAAPYVVATAVLQAAGDDAVDLDELD